MFGKDVENTAENTVDATPEVVEETTEVAEKTNPFKYVAAGVSSVAAAAYAKAKDANPIVIAGAAFVAGASAFAIGSAIYNSRQAKKWAACDECEDCCCDCCDPEDYSNVEVTEEEIEE